MRPPIRLLCSGMAFALSQTALCNPMPNGSLIHADSLAPLPDPEGFAGMFAGISQNTFLVAGGANIQEPRWNNPLRKKWYASVWVLEKPGTQWISASTPEFQLPEPLAYGVSVTIPEGVLCIGGSTPNRHQNTVFVMRWENRSLQIRSFPPLPYPCANACGALVGRTVYLAGGTVTPSDSHALHRFLALDLDNMEAGWRELPPWPGCGRILGVAGSAAGCFYLFSGARLDPGPDGTPVRTYLRDAFRYVPGKGWDPLPDLPRPAVAAPSPAAATADGRLLIAGGDDGSQIGFTPLDQHPGFSRNLLAYSIEKNSWTVVGELPFSTVTAPAVVWEGRWVIPSGETRPRVRTPNVWALSLLPK